MRNTKNRGGRLYMGGRDYNQHFPVLKVTGVDNRGGS